MIRDSSWALSLLTSNGAAPLVSAPSANGAPAIAPDGAPRRLAVIDDTPAAASFLPGTVGYQIAYACGNGAGQGNGSGANRQGMLDSSHADSGIPKWALWLSAGAGGLFILDWAMRRKR